MGRRRRAAGPEGVLVVDKPAGPTSHDVVEAVRRAVGQPRIGHTGTLDPSATGVLVLCLGRATRLVRFLQAGTKTYAARLVLGVETTTQDGQGEVVASRSAAHVDERRFCEALLRFRGRIEQVPPMVSAVRVGGERLHEKARRGESVERAARTVTVHDLVLDAFEPGERPEASFLVTCSAGTYVRTIAHDVGQVLGVGAHLSSLRRLANGPFTIDEAHELDRLLHVAAQPSGLGSLVLDVPTAVARVLPVVRIDDHGTLRSLASGGRLPRQGIDGPFVVTDGTRVVGIYTDREDDARPELVWTRPEELT